MSLPIFIPGTDNRYWAGTTGKITDAYSGLEVPTYIKEPYLGPLVDLEVDGKKKAYLASCATTEEPFLRRAYFIGDDDMELPSNPSEGALRIELEQFIPGTQFRYRVTEERKIIDTFSGLEVPTYHKAPYLGPLMDLMVGKETWTCLHSAASSDKPCLKRAIFPETLLKERPDAPKEVRALRHNSGKPLTCCINPSLLLETGAVFAKGAEKYSIRNYQKSIGTESHDEYLESVRESMMRHVYKYLSGEKLDSETGLSHLAHMVANASIASEYEGYSDE